jgi:translocation and assembly module TamA
MAQCFFSPRARRRHSRPPWPLAVCLLGCSLAQAAGIKVEVRGVDQELRTNVLAYLSFQRYQKGGAELNADTIERLQNRVEREVQQALRPFGYYEPKVDSKVSAEGPGEWRVVIDISPGPPILLGEVDVRVEGPGASDPLFQRILKHNPLHVGGRLQHAEYEGVKADLQRTAATYGYLDAKLTRNEVNVDPPNHRADIALRLDTGQRYRFGATSIEQNVIRNSRVRRYLRYREGDFFDLTQVLRTQFALDDSQYFTNLEVLPGEPDREQLTVPVTIRADPSRRHRYSFAAGYATDTGIRGTVGFEDRHINTLGHSFSVGVQASQVQRYYVQSRYRIPVGDPALENISLNATVVQEKLADVNVYTQSAGVSFTTVGGRWQYVPQVNAVRTKSDDINGSSTARLLVPELDLASVPKGYLGEPLFERPLFVELKGSNAALGSDANFLQLHVQAERVFGLIPKWHLLLRGEVGSTLVSHFEDLPVAYRYFAGGDNSVRGFAYNELSPLEPVCTQNASGQYLRNANGTCQEVASYIKVGGKDVLTGTVEVIRELPRNLGVATFFDFGNALNSFGKPACLPAPVGGSPVCQNFLEYSVGIGLRLRLPVLTLGVDLAQPLSVNAGPRLHINFSPKL